MTDKAKDFDRYRYGINCFADGYKAGAASVLDRMKENAGDPDLISAAKLIQKYCLNVDSCEGCPFAEGPSMAVCKLENYPGSWRVGR